MGLFSKRDEVEPDEDDFGPAEKVTMLALLRFNARGVDVEADQDTAGLDTVLVAADGQRYPLRPLIQRAIAGEDPVDPAVEFVDAIVSARGAEEFEAISAEDLKQMVRTIVVTAEEADGVGANYAVPVSGGLVAVLAVDHDTYSVVLPGAWLADHDTEELFAQGMRNVMAEPIEEFRDLGHGTQIFVGSSAYIASKALGMSQLLSEHAVDAPHGLLFGIPNPNLLYVHPLTGKESLSTVRRIAMLVAAQAVRPDPDSEPLSRDLFIFRRGRIERAGGVEGPRELKMDVRGLLLEAMLELAGPNWTHDMFGIGEVSRPAPVAPAQQEFFERVRVRVVSDGAVKALGITYAAEVAPGLHQALCLDGEDEVIFVTDEMLDGIDLEPLIAAGRTNTMNEPLDTTQDIGHGIKGLYGESMFTASKVLGMEQLIGSVLPLAPYGVLFGVPHRHVLYVHVITGAEAIEAVGRLAHHVDTVAKDGPIPGGPISAWTYYWHEGTVDIVAGVNDRGVQIDGSGRFGELMASFAAE